MKKLIAAALLATTLQAHASGVRLDVDTFEIDVDLGRAKIIAKVSNDTAQGAAMIVIECAFLDANERAVDTATLIASNVSARSVAYAQGYSARIDGIEGARCRIASAR